MLGQLRRYRQKSIAIETVRRINADFNDNRLTVLEYASPDDPKGVSDLHFQTNLKISECLEQRSLGTCLHITGRMNAIHDPFHSDLCTTIFRRTDSPFKFSYFDQEEPDRTPIDIVKQKKIMWSSNHWKTSLAALRKESQSQIETYSVADQSAVQFTVFGNRFVQLQSQHDDAGSNPVSKHVWLIESQKMHDVLLEHATSVISNASQVPANLFREAYDLMFGVGAKIVLNRLSSVEAFEKEHAILAASDFHSKPAEVVAALTEFGFLCDGERVSITQRGRELLEAVNGKP